MTLFIDTTERERFRLAFLNKDSFCDVKVSSRARFSEKLSQVLQKQLQKYDLRLESIEKIVVVRGPGSFVGTRTGVSFANALSWSLDIPIASVRAEDVPEDLLVLKKEIAKKRPVVVAYSAPPNITKSSKLYKKS